MSAAEHTPAPQAPDAQRLDPAQQSLADALKTSFFLLKVAMVVMAGAYLFGSGVFTVEPREKAIRLVLGEVVTDPSGAPREYGPGTYWGWPFPIERAVRVPAEAHDVRVEQAFLPKLTPEERKALDADETAKGHASLDPAKDGSLITADAGLVHLAASAKWRVRAVKEFLTAVGDPQTGDDLVRAAIERGMVLTAARTTADQALTRAKELAEAVRQSAQEALPPACGIEIIETEMIPALSFAPLPTREAFASVSKARSEQDKLLGEANQYASRVLGDAAGPAQSVLRDLISLEELANLKEGSDGELTQALRRELALAFERLDTAGPALEETADAYAKAASAGTDGLPAARQALLAALKQAADPAFVRTGPTISGTTRTKMAQAEAYRTTTAASLRAEANAFEAQYAQYQANPVIFMTRRWQAMREKVFTSPTVETFFVPIDRLSVDTGRDLETAGKVDDLLRSERTKKVGVE